jgi:hypothetical protein
VQQKVIKLGVGGGGSKSYGVARVGLSLAESGGTKHTKQPTTGHSRTQKILFSLLDSTTAIYSKRMTKIRNFNKIGHPLSDQSSFHFEYFTPRTGYGAIQQYAARGSAPWQHQQLFLLPRPAQFQLHRHPPLVLPPDDSNFIPATSYGLTMSQARFCTRPFALPLVARRSRQFSYHLEQRTRQEDQKVARILAFYFLLAITSTITNCGSRA